MPQAIWSLSLFVLEYIAKKNPSDPRREVRQDRIKEGRNRKKELVHRCIYSTKNLVYVHYKMCAKILVCMDEVTVFRQRHIDSSARQVSEIPIGEAAKSRSLGGATFTKQVCSSFKKHP